MHLVNVHTALMGHLSNVASCVTVNPDTTSTAATGVFDPVAFYNFMRINTIGLVDEYKRALTKPIRIQFFAKHTSQSPCESSADMVIARYAHVVNSNALEIVRIFTTHNPEALPAVQAILDEFLRIGNTNMGATSTGTGAHSPGSPMGTCARCAARDSIVQDGNMYTCIRCGNLLDLVCTASTLKDIERVNIASKYTYDRSSHFRILLAQLQGKGTVSPTLQAGVSAVKELMETHKLSKDMLSKRHVSMFIRDAGLGKNMDDIASIHKCITGKPPLNLSMYEEILVKDYEQVLLMKDRMQRDLERECADGKRQLDNQIKAMNMHSILYRLLLKHGVVLSDDDKVLFERKGRNEHMLCSIFKRLNWPWT